MTRRRFRIALGEHGFNRAKPKLKQRLDIGKTFPGNKVLMDPGKSIFPTVGEVLGGGALFGGAIIAALLYF